MSELSWEALSSYAKVDRIDHSKGHVYIGRGSKWGNLATLSDRGMSRTKAVLSYVDQLWEMWITGKVSTNDLLALQGETLGCFCFPKLCHGMIIVILGTVLKEKRIEKPYSQLQADEIAEVESCFRTRASQFVETYSPVVIENSSGQGVLF
jgi:hypothetical protein